MRPFHLCAHRRRVVETEQPVCVVDQQVEVFEEILPENPLQVRIGGETLEVINKDLLLGNSVRTGLNQVELRVGSRLTRSHSNHLGPALSIQMKGSGERRIDHRDLGAAIQ